MPAPNPPPFFSILVLRGQQPRRSETKQREDLLFPWDPSGETKNPMQILSSGWTLWKVEGATRTQRESWAQSE